MKHEFSHRIFEKTSDVIFQENLSSGSQDVPCRPEECMDGHGKLIVSFHHFMNRPNNSMYSVLSIYRFSREWRKQSMNAGKREIQKTTFFF
jgi:hypothetical protein